MGKKMVLTPAGERVRSAAARVLDEVQRAEDDVRQLVHHGAGTIRVCAQCNTGYYWLPPLLARFEHDHPRVAVRILPEATARPVEAVLEGMLDLAIVIDDVHDPRLRVDPLFKDEQVVIVSPSHRLASRSWVDPKDLAQEHLMLYTTDPDDSFALKNILAPAGVTPARVSSVRLTEAIVEMVRAGLGIGLLARWSVEPSIRAGRIRALRITRKGVQRQWSAIDLAARPRPPYLTAFLDLLRAQALPTRKVG
jgi:LysR family transcriptional regulator for metE and metH